MERADLVVRNIGRLATLAGSAPRVGAALGNLAVEEDAALAASGGRLVYVGPDADLEAAVTLGSGSVVLDACDAAVIPGFVDAHTHLVYAGDREDEIRRRLAGVSYAQIAAEGGGIVRTVEATRAAPAEELMGGLLGRFDELLRLGTTSVEVKSGYGLDTETELRSLEAIREASLQHPIGVVATFLGAHEIPVELRDDRERYVARVIHEMLPEVVARDLAAFCDVFCEEGAFSVDESRRVLSAAAEHGLGLRVHADELAPSGGSLLAAELRARSADHLIHVDHAGMRALAEAGTLATLLPSAAFYLRLGRYAPARELVAAGVPVALASDANPGGGLSPSMPFALTCATFGMGLSLEEALSAATLNAACSLGIEGDAGSLEVGKRADFLILRAASLLDLVRVGVAAISVVVKEGRVVARDGRLLARAEGR